MTVNEISDRLDEILSSNYGGIKVNEYVKSLYLTQAQQAYVTGVLSAYEYGDKLRHLVGPLLVDGKIEGTSFTQKSNWVEAEFNVPVEQIVYEKVNDSIMTIPLDYNDIHFTLDNPFRKPDITIAYRNVASGKIILFCSESIDNYYYIYCKIPKPIILENLPTGLDVQGETTSQTSVLSYESILNIIDLAAELLVKDKARFAPKPEKEEGQTKR